MKGLGLRVENLGVWSSAFSVKVLGLRVERCKVWIQGCGVGVSGLGSRVPGLGLRVEGGGLECFELKIQASGFWGFRVEGLGFRDARDRGLAL